MRILEGSGRNGPARVNCKNRFAEVQAGAAFPTFLPLQSKEEAHARPFRLCTRLISSINVLRLATMKLYHEKLVTYTIHVYNCTFVSL